MLPLFTTPLAFAGLASLPALVAIYYLRNRPRRQIVSSLLLWVDPLERPDGGIRFERLRAPLLFWLELLALLLLTLAAAGPRQLIGTSSRPLIVILDDSFSMLAGAPDSPRQRAADALLEDLRKISRSSVRVVLAGDRPQLLGEGAQRAAEIERVLGGWTCQSPSAAIDPAIAFALELGGELATILVLTDHPPNPLPGEGRVRWWSFGTARANWAFVNASRVAGPRGDRLLLEIANLATEARSTTLRIEAGEPAQEIRRSDLQLNAFETQRVILEVPGGEATRRIRAVLDSDELPFDNAVILLPPVRKTARYDLQLADARLRASVERALKASGMASPADARPNLIFRDANAEQSEHGDEWSVRILVESEAEAFTGPFVMDRSHPLMEGLSLTGVVWGGGKSRMPGEPVVMAGNVPLLTDSESPTGKHDLQLRLRQDLSTLTDSPAWPALIWNLVQWRIAYLPGLDRSTVRLGQEVNWTLGSTTETVEVVRPGGEVTVVPVRGRRVAIRAERPGVYLVRAGGESAEFASNPISRDESDLTACASGKWGDELGSTATGYEFRDLTWILILIVLAILTLHLAVRSWLRVS
jgi:hypothetical protein